MAAIDAFTPLNACLQSARSAGNPMSERAAAAVRLLYEVSAPAKANSMRQPSGNDGAPERIKEN